MEVKYLTVQDLAGVISIIDVCSQRGGFRGEELSGVGGIREKFLAEVQEQQPDAVAAPGAVDVPQAPAEVATDAESSDD